MNKSTSTKILPQISEQEKQYLHVYGTRVHNLKNIDVHIPRNQFVVITGISGSGKSSLAFDTIFAEGQRRYIESFSSYARQFLGSMERPDVDKITGLSPVISIEQKTTNKNPRSTVGTITEIYDFMRLLYARAGIAYSMATGNEMIRFSEEQIKAQLLEHYKDKKIIVLAPLVKGRKGHYRELFERLRKQGFLKVRIDGEIEDLLPNMQIDRYKIHDIEAVVDRLLIQPEYEERINNAIEKGLKMGEGMLMVLDYESNEIKQYSKNLMCSETGIAYEEPSPNSFSFNSPYGACPHCKGLGVISEIDMNAIIPDYKKSINQGAIAPLGEVRENNIFKQVRSLAKKYDFSLSVPIEELPQKALELLLYGNFKPQYSEDTKLSRWERKYTDAFEGVVPLLKHSYHNSSSDKIRKWAESFMEKIDCPECDGTRLKKESLQFKIGGANIAELSRMDLQSLLDWFNNVEAKLNEKQKVIAKEILKEIRSRLGFLLNVGLNYLNLDRPTRTLSGGESQRIRLATQIGSQLIGISYILDEPSIGLHQRDNERLINSLKQLCEMGNSVLVVEHDKDIMLAADYLIDLGPGAGKLGGEIVAEGLPSEFAEKNSLTAKYLRGEKSIPVPQKRRKGNGKFIELFGATGNNLKTVDLRIPLATYTVVTGVSGSGKSTLINETLYPILRQHLYKSRKKPMPYTDFHGLELIDKVIDIDQSPIGRTPRSNPATYIGVFSDIRNIFAQLPEAKIRGYKPGRFSFNVKGGRCETCEGAGIKVIEMNFLPDVHVECEKCLGKRYNRETLEVRYKGKSISDVLNMPVRESAEFFEAIPSISRKLETLVNVGLGYLTLGQSSTTLSGGEAQRVKLASELSKKDSGSTLYILDEPTTGLHFEDIRLLLQVLDKLVKKGNTVIVIEHNMDVIKVADHIVDLGPEGGHKGGYILFEGTPEALAQKSDNHTGRFLKGEL
ncbi:MAG: excinuclease ABC subunit UvrA [Chitinophagales bacterium]